MNKTEVAEALNCSTRQVEKYASGGRLGEIIYVRGKRGREAQYAAAEVERLKAELEAERETVIGKPPALIQQRDAAPLAAGGATNDERLLLMAARIAQEMMKHLPALLPPAPNGEAPTPADSLSIADKLTLGIADASRLSGLSKESLRTAINAGKLKAKIVAGRRGWTIKRDDLDLYVKKL
jgi:hypothetical protein